MHSSNFHFPHACIYINKIKWVLFSRWSALTKQKYREHSNTHPHNQVSTNLDIFCMFASAFFFSFFLFFCVKPNRYGWGLLDSFLQSLSCNLHPEPSLGFVIPSHALDIVELQMNSVVLHKSSCTLPLGLTLCSRGVFMLSHVTLLHSFIYCHLHCMG